MTLHLVQIKHTRHLEKKLEIFEVLEAGFGTFGLSQASCFQSLC